MCIVVVVGFGEGDVRNNVVVVVEDGSVMVIGRESVERGRGEYMRYFFEKKDRPVRVMVTVVRTVTVLVEMGVGFGEYSGRGEVGEPWAATTEAVATRRRGESFVRIVRRGERRRRGQWRKDMCWGREAAAETRIVDGLEVSMSSRQMECSRKRTLVARLLPISPQK